MLHSNFVFLLQRRYESIHQVCLGNVKRTLVCLKLEQLTLVINSLLYFMCRLSTTSMTSWRALKLKEMSLQCRHDVRPSAYSCTLHCRTLATTLTLNFWAEYWHVGYSFHGERSPRFWFFSAFSFSSYESVQDRRTARHVMRPIRTAAQ